MTTYADDAKGQPGGPGRAESARRRLIGVCYDAGPEAEVVMKTLRVPEKLWLDLVIAAAWERIKVLDLLHRLSRDYLENRVLPSLNPDKSRRAEVLRSLKARGLSQRQIAAAPRTPLGAVNRGLRGQFQQPRRKTGGRRRPAPKDT